MKAWQLLQMPWYTAPRSLRWFVAIVLALCVAATVAVETLSDDPARWKGSLLSFVVGQITLWMLLLPGMLRLAIDTRQLRVPAAGRWIIGSLLVYALLSVTAPALWLATRGAPVAPVVALLALCACGGMAWALLPTYLGMFLCWLPFVLTTLQSRLHLPGMADPQMVLSIVLLALALLLVTVRRARALVGDDHGYPQKQRWSSPMALQMGYLGGAYATTEKQRLRQSPSWLRPLPDLAGAGPSRPEKAIRVMLGGVYLPQTWQSHARLCGAIICIVAVTLGVLILMPDLLAGHSLAEVIERLGAMRGVQQAIFLGPVVVVVALMGTLMGANTAARLSKRWDAVNAEMPLLALLPGLGAMPDARRILVRAVLGLPLLVHTATAFLLGAAVLFWQQYIHEWGFLLLAQLGSATVTAALLLNIVGGRALATWHRTMLLVLCLILTVLSLVLPLFAWNGADAGWARALLLSLTAGWLLLVLGMARLIQRGWRGLQQLPHPFLAH